MNLFLAAGLIHAVPVLWLLFTVAAIAFAWGASGAATILAGYRCRPRVVFLVPLTPGRPSAGWSAATITTAVTR